MLVVVGPTPVNRLPQTAMALQVAVEVGCSDMEHQLSAQPGPPHLAHFAHALIDQHVHCRLDVGRRDPLALAPRSTVIHQGTDVRMEIAFKFVKAFEGRFELRGVAARRVNFVAVREKLRTQADHRYHPPCVP